MASAAAATTTKNSEGLTSVESICMFDFLWNWLTLHLNVVGNSGKPLRKIPYGVSYPIYKYPCQIFLIDYDRNGGRIRVWLREDAVLVEKCSDYMSEKYQGNIPSWVCKWIDINPEWLVDRSSVSDDGTLVLPDFYRITGDFEVAYGDGGYSHLVYPVWIQEHLPLKEYRRVRLLEHFYQLNDERKDFHEEPSPVEDIIDPDLLAYRPRQFDRRLWIENERRRLAHQERKLRYFNRDINQGDYNDLSEHEQLRDTYQWLPSEFTIETDGKVDIRTPIHHLPILPEFRNSYGDIAKIFHLMLPMFEELKVIQRNRTEQQTLQVIIKVQSYNLKAGMTYSGRWHTEGQTENIIAVGVYYLHIDEQLEGGDLKFRPREGPQEYYDHIEVDRCVSGLKTGSAVVFSNAIPHRFRQIRNLTPDDNRRRTFINFFIVDPDHLIPVRSNQVFLAPQTLIDQAIDVLSGGRFPDLVLERLYSYIDLSSLWRDSHEAKEFRRRVRRAMLREKSGWGWICWGNCGTTQFVRALCAMQPRERREIKDTLQHTASDSSPKN